MPFCDKCGDHMWSKNQAECNCKEYIVLDENEESHSFWAKTPEDAAEKYARYYNEDGDYHLMNDSLDITIEGKKFTVGAEPDIHYWVREQTEKDASNE